MALYGGPMNRIFTTEGTESTEPDMNALFKRIHKECVKSPPIPKKLYHYTGMDSAKSIVEGNEIWFTNAHFMNDSKEIKSGLEIAWEILEEFWHRCDTEENGDIAMFFYCLANVCVLVFEEREEREQLLKKLENQLSVTQNSQFCIFRDLRPRDIFVSCFSGEKSIDSLPMWNMYADSANGVNIGFNGNNLIKRHLALKHNIFPNVGFIKVVYKTEKYKTIIKNYFEKLYKFIINTKKENRSMSGLAKNRYFFSLAVDYMIMIVVSYKNSFFSHEDEWRLFLIYSREKNHKNKFFDIKNNIINSKFKIQYNDNNSSIIEDFIVGPNNLNDRDWIYNWLLNSGCKANFIKSEIPFRRTKSNAT